MFRVLEHKSGKSRAQYKGRSEHNEQTRELRVVLQTLLEASDERVEWHHEPAEEGIRWIHLGLLVRFCSRTNILVVIFFRNEF